MPTGTPLLKDKMKIIVMEINYLLILLIHMKMLPIILKTTENRMMKCLKITKISKRIKKNGLMN